MSIAKNYTLKLDIGTVTDTGKLVKFENLKQYTISNKGRLPIIIIFSFFTRDLKMIILNVSDYCGGTLKRQNI